MASLRLQFERDYEFSPAIVWDALVDPVLLSGWLAEATVEPEAGGRFDLWSTERFGVPHSRGRIDEIIVAERLVVQSDALGPLSFELTEFPGGSRGTSTRLRLIVQPVVDAAFAARVRADWLTTLDQLEQLLRGHPVDWANWDRDHRDTWTQHLAAGTAGGAPRKPAG